MNVDEIMALADEYGNRRAVELVDYADDFGDSGADIGSLTDKTNAARAALRAAVEQLEQDALRYRWLRDRFVGKEGIAGHIAISFDDVLHIHYSMAGTWPHGVDAAIDAAMKEGK